MEVVKQLHPAKVWDDISPRLYTAFWVLSMYDLHTPTGRYDEEIGRAKQAISDLETSSDLVQFVWYECFNFVYILKYLFCFLLNSVNKSFICDLF